MPHDPRVVDHLGHDDARARASARSAGSGCRPAASSAARADPIRQRSYSVRASGSSAGCASSSALRACARARASAVKRDLAVRRIGNQRRAPAGHDGAVLLPLGAQFTGGRQLEISEPILPASDQVALVLERLLLGEHLLVSEPARTLEHRDGVVGPDALRSGWPSGVRGSVAGAAAINASAQTATSEPSSFSSNFVSYFLRFGFTFSQTSAAEDVAERVVAFVAGVLEEQVVGRAATLTSPVHGLTHVVGSSTVKR